MTGWQVYKRLLGYTSEYRWVFLLSIVGFVLYAATQAGWAQFLKYILEVLDASDIVDKSSNLNYRNSIAGWTIALFFIRGIGSYLGVYATAYVARHVVFALREAMFAKMLHVDNGYYHQQTQGRIVAKMAYDVEQVGAASTDALKTLLQEGFTVIGLIIYLVYTNWKLAFIFFSLVPLIGWVVIYASRRLSALSHQIQDSMGNVSHVVSETIHNYQSVKIYGGEAYEAKRFLTANTNNLRRSIKLVGTQALNTPLVQLLLAFAFAFVMWLGLHPFIFSGMTQPAFVAFITAAALLAKPVRQLTQLNSTLQRGVAGARSVFEMIDVPDEKNLGTQQLDHVIGRVTFENVAFCYPCVEDLQPQEWIVSDINIAIEAKEKIALVGHSGSGKTTLINLIARFLSPDKGRVLVDEYSIADLELEGFRRHVAIMSQSEPLFNDTLFRNIAYGALVEASEEAVWAVLEKVSAADFVKHLPNGIHTCIGGEKGVQLSGGQQQRILLARAILKDAPIVILDEATSALDQETEKEVQRALKTLLKDKTVIIIAHRLATIESADRILVLKSGRIVEQGHHRELLDKEGVYAQMYQAGFY